jgi:hypothetical protein
VTRSAECCERRCSALRVAGRPGCVRRRCPHSVRLGALPSAAAFPEQSRRPACWSASRPRSAQTPTLPCLACPSRSCYAGCRRQQSPDTRDRRWAAPAPTCRQPAQFCL